MSSNIVTILSESSTGSATTQDTLRHIATSHTFQCPSTILPSTTRMATLFAASNYSTEMVINKNGVGIGSSSPTVALDVVGNVNVTGSINTGTQFLGQANDSVTAPSFSWTGNTNCGMYRVGADVIGFTNAGVESMRISATQTTVGNATENFITANASYNRLSVNYYTSNTPLTANRTYRCSQNIINNNAVKTGSFTPYAEGQRNGIYNAATTDGSGQLGTAAGCYNYIENRAATTGLNTIDNAYGTYNYINQSRAGTTTNAFGTWNNMNRSAGTLTNSYGVYCNTSGTITNSYGVYTTGEQKNYFSGNVGIGTANPAQKLDVRGNVDIYTAEGTAELRIISFDPGAGGYSSIQLSNNQNVDPGLYSFDLRYWGPSSPRFSIINHQNSAVGNEAFTVLRSNGYVGIGTANPASLLHLFLNSSVGANMTIENKSASGFAYMTVKNNTTYYEIGVGGSSTSSLWANRLFINPGPGSPQYGVYLTSTSTAWSALSDERVKNIIEPITSGVDKINRIRPIIYAMKNDASNARRVGVIAQDVMAVLPEACDIPNNSDDLIGVRYTDLIPLLIAAVRELSARVVALEAPEVVPVVVEPEVVVPIAPEEPEIAIPVSLEEPEVVVAIAPEKPEIVTPIEPEPELIVTPPMEETEVVVTP